VSIALSLKINDGLVLAADSASTLSARNAQGEVNVVNTYNNANKIFNLVKGLPIGVVAWGSGSIGLASIATLIKDLRRRLSGENGNSRYKDWVIDKKGYTVQWVADKVLQFIYHENYLEAFKEWPKKPSLGFIVGGYSADASMADEYLIQIVEGRLEPPKLLRQNLETGATWGGVGEPLNRLILGYGTGLPKVLQEKMGVPAQNVQQALGIIQNALGVPLVAPAMPLQDAIDLAEFMVDLTIKWVRFAPGPPTVGGPIELAAISKHEGFRWVRRKYYFSKEMNPEEPWKKKPEV
jgi:hypothetical protein